MSAMARTILRLRNPSATPIITTATRLWSFPAFCGAFGSSFSTSKQVGVTPSAAEDVVVDDRDSYVEYAETVALPAAVELPNLLQPRVVIFDGVCNLLSHWLKVYGKLVKNMAVLCKEAKKLLSEFSEFNIKHVLRSSNAEADAQANLAIKLKDGEVEESLGI